jgi:hypothetical protein
VENERRRRKAKKYINPLLLRILEESSEEGTSQNEN